MRRIAERALSLYGIEPVTISLLDHAYNTTFAVTGPTGARAVLHYLYDLAVTISELADLPHPSQLCMALLAGYRQVRYLSPPEEVLIDTFVILREVQNLAWFLTMREDPSYRKWAEQIEARVTSVERLVHVGPGDSR